MNTLTIPEIFANFSYYQENYLSILQHPEHYYAQVEQSHLNIWPVAEKPLYLGDLLQLWLSQKWLIHNGQVLEQDSQGQKRPIQPGSDFYLFQLTGNALSGFNRAKVWSVAEQKVVLLTLDHGFKYLCYYASIDRPQAHHQQPLLKSFKTAV